VTGNLKLGFADSIVLVALAILLFAFEFTALNKTTRRYFYFLNFGIGKGITLLFLTPLLLTFPNKVGVALAVWIGANGLFFCVLP
jgi:hypothetical protein